MYLLNTKFFIFVGILVVVLYSTGECKRGGGGRRGSVSRGSSVWGRSRQSQSHDLRNNQRKSKSQPAEVEPVKKPPEIVESSKPSAPPSPSKVDATKQTSSSGPAENPSQAPQQRPIGWDVNQNTKPDAAGNRNIGWNVGNTNNQPSPGGGVGNAPPPYSSTGNHPPPYSSIGQPPPPYSSIGNSPNLGANSQFGTGSNYPHGQGFQQPPYPHQQVPGQYGTHNTGFMSQPGPQYPNMNGYGNAPMGGSFLGNHKYNKHGFGGYGGYGGYPGYGGYGMGGYGKKYGGGFGMGFGKHAVRNVVMGLLVWHLVSGLTRRPYNVYNYYNNPEKVPEEIPLPANTIVLCPENVTSLCAPNTASLCTTDNKIMCVVLAQKTIPCDNNSTLKCVNSTATCGDEDNPCDEKSPATTSVNIPCITNATVIGKVKNSAVSGLNAGNTTDLCVTTLAVPQSEEEQKTLAQTQCEVANATNLDNKNSTVCDTTLQLHNTTTQASISTTELTHSIS